MTPAQRWLRKTQVEPNGCLTWTGALNNHGYANFWDSARYVSGHRYSYEQFVGPVPEGLVLDHLCRTPNCVRWDHLEPVTQRTNLLRGDTVAAKHAAKTACPLGHPYTYRPSGTTRVCLPCCRERDRRRRPARNITTNNQGENA